MPRGVLVIVPAPLYGTYNTKHSPVQQMFYKHPCQETPARRALPDHEVEPTSEPSGVLGGPHQQRLAEQAVGTVLRFAREIELGGQHAAAARLYLHMDVAGAPGVNAR